ncbi:MAG: alpha/beta hydrolase [Actinomycetota bacterium]
MSAVRTDEAEIHYDDEGAGFPALLIAPGGMRSANEFWPNMPWNPRELADSYRVIGMDQRNAGRSTGAISAETGWATYAGDQLAVLDDLSIDRCHVVGMCIGGPYIAGLLRLAPERFASAVMLQPVGIDDNREALEEMFDDWAAGLADDHPSVDEAAWASFRSNMWGGDFLLTASPDDVESFTTPLLVMMGDDLYHPQSTSREIVRRASDATLVERWKDEDVLGETDRTIRDFLAAHTPA